MEMQNLIGDQSIVRRQKPVRIVLDSGLVREARNGRIERSRIPRARKTDHAFESIAVKNRIQARPTGTRFGTNVDGPRPTLFSALDAIKRTLLAKRGAATPIIGITAIALICITIAAVGAAERYVDLSGFYLPEDATISSMLLDAVSAEEQKLDEEAGSPVLPVTLSLSSYKVAKNDTLDGIAKRYDVRLDTLISINGIRDVRRIAAGTTLKIPNIDGVVHTVRKGDNLSGIASSRGVSILDIIDANDLSTQTILPGQSLFIPGARLSSYDLKRALGKLVMWPISGRISSYFGYRPNPFTGIRQYHNGLDIVGPVNMPAKAAMDGRVAETGYSAVFGNFVIMTHAEGYQTLYAHLNKIMVKTGKSLTQGDIVGLVGTTGYSTGTHLHFGVFKNGSAIDPLKLLKGK